MTVNNRPLIVGPTEGPEAPYPLRMEGTVISGFGRGSKELGIPTANLPVDSNETAWITDKTSGVYFGWASLALGPTHADFPGGEVEKPVLFPMVMSIGYNPFYQNTVRSAEVHVLHKFSEDFYGVHMRLLIMGFIRAERNYDSLEALVEDIKFDCEVGKASLKRKFWAPKGEKVVGGGYEEGELDVQWLVKEAPKPKVVETKTQEKKTE